MTENIITKRNGTPVKFGDGNSYILSLTGELLDMGLDLPIDKDYKKEKFENSLTITLVEIDNKKKIVIEKNEV